MISSSLKRLGAVIAAVVLASPTCAIGAAPGSNETVINVTAAVPTSIQGVVELETDSPASASVRMAEDLAGVVGDGATRRVLPIIGSNALQSITDLMLLHGIDMAILPADAVSYVREQRLYPNIGAVSYVAKLYEQEFHLLARRDIASVADLASRKVNVDPATGGTAITAGRVFRELNIPIAPTNDDSATALEKLRRGEIDAIAFVGTKPAALFMSDNINPAEGLHFLNVAVRDPSYQPVQLTPEDYPGLVPQNTKIDTISVSMALFVAPFPRQSERYKNIARVVNTFFTQLASLQQGDHDRNWQKIALDDSLASWSRFEPADDWVKRNAAVASSDPEAMKEQFFRFLDARAQSAGAAPMSAFEKEVLFDQFRRWQNNPNGASPFAAPQFAGPALSKP
jgi:uncharacterized protein